MHCAVWTMPSYCGNMGQLTVLAVLCTVPLDFLGTALSSTVLFCFATVNINHYQFDEYFQLLELTPGEVNRLHRKAVALAHVCSQVMSSKSQLEEEILKYLLEKIELFLRGLYLFHFAIMKLLQIF